MAITLGPITKITDNTFDDRLPAVIDGNRIVFGQINGGNRNIALFNNGGIVFIDQNPNNFLVSDIDTYINGEIIWTRQFGVGDNDVYRYNGTNVLQVDFNAADSSHPSIAKPGTYVYQLGPNLIKVQDSVLGNRDINGREPDADGNKVVYIDASGQIAVTDFAANSTQTITTSATIKNDPHIFGDRIVWTENNGAGGTTEIMTANLGGAFPQVQQITTNNSNDRNPDIHGNLIVWERVITPSESDIFVYDAGDGSIQNVTASRTGNATDPSIGNGGIAWVENDGDNEIFFASATSNGGGGYDPLTGLTQQQGRELAGLYKTWFGRVPDRGGWEFWKNLFTQGVLNMAQIAEGFANSAEAHGFYDYLPGDVGPNPNAAKADMINRFYLQLFDRPAEIGGFTFWSNILNQNNEYFSDDLSLAMIRSASPGDLARIDANILLI